MNRIKILLGGLIVLVGFVGAWKIESHSHQSKEPPPPLLGDGAVNPAIIPDLVAYEFLFTSTANMTNMTDLERSRGQMLAGKLGLNANSTARLQVIGREFMVNIKNIDAEAQGLKSNFSLNPPSIVVSRLAELQKQKEAFLRQAIDSLQTQLGSEEKEKLNARLLEIKKKVKVYKSDLR